MKYQSAQSHRIKTTCLEWLRLQQRCAFLGTEVGGWSADVLGISETKMIEIEVKCSIEDLRNDFSKSKHTFYNRTYDVGAGLWTPSHFYFCMPEALVEKALVYLDKQPKAKSYGVIQWEDMVVRKPAKRLHDKPINSKLKFMLALRMGSMLIRFHRDWVAA